MERFYTRPGLYIKEYPVRGAMILARIWGTLTYLFCSAFGSRVPPLVTHISEGFPSHTGPQDLVPRRPLKRTYAMMGVYCLIEFKLLFTNVTDLDRRCQMLPQMV